LLLTLTVTGYLLATAVRHKPVRVRGRDLRLPSLRLALGQLGMSVLDWLLSSASLYVLLASVSRVPYLDFLAAFLLAQIAALVLPLPGGIGVFEAVIVVLRPAAAAVPHMLAGLLLYRVVYYLLPLLAAGALIAIREIVAARKQGRALVEMLGRLGSLAPHVLALVTFLSGALLLLTGAVPTDERRLAWLANLLPLAAIEASHFLASVVGSVLLILAWALERRVRLAYRLAQALFSVGILLAVLRSVDLRVALLLGVVLVMLHSLAAEFPRAASLLREPLDPGWGTAIGAVLITTIWVGLFAYRYEAYSRQLWWRFALYGDAPRFLRAIVGMSVVVLLFALARLLGRDARTS
jgi:phosphatidylglycerol lysyltransferase